MIDIIVALLNFTIAAISWLQVTTRVSDSVTK